MKRLLCLAGGVLLSMAVQANVLTPEQLLERIRSRRSTEEQLMHKREQEFLQVRDKQAQLLAEAKKSWLSKNHRQPLYSPPLPAMSTS